MKEPIQIFAVVIRYPHIDFYEYDTFFFDEEEAIKRMNFLQKYNSGKVFLQEEWVS